MGKEVALAYVGMVMAEGAKVGLMILSKAAMSNGMSFILYSNSLASLVLLPTSLLFHCVMGGIVIAIGFYAVIWGKAGELKMAQDIKSIESNLESSSTHEALLLANGSTDV